MRAVDEKLIINELGPNVHFPETPAELLMYTSLIFDTFFIVAYICERLK